MTNTKILNKILEDRERRFALRQAMNEQGLASVSLNFNIPSFPKSSEDVRKAFALVQKDLQHYFIANRIEMVAEAAEVLHSDCGDFYLQGVRYSCEDARLKNLLERFEQTHLLGRLLDVDLMNEKGEVISSGKAKKCFLCEEPAKECMKAQRHEYAEYHTFVAKKIASFLEGKIQQEVVGQITEMALKATLFEASIPQKPGLVCPTSNGSHSDMDYFTFLSSSASLSSYWTETANLGYKAGKERMVDYTNLCVQLRLMGLEAEERMLKATNGVNTQKGIIFLLGLGCFAAAFSLAQQQEFDSALFRKCLKNLTQGIVEEDLGKKKSTQGTHGEIVFERYGKSLAGGARQEAEEAFPTVFKLALPYLRTQMGAKHKHFSKEKWQEVALRLLLLIISENNDINILYRKNMETLSSVKAQAKLAFSADEKHFDAALQSFQEYCVLQNISPGGAADLLALSLFVYFIENLRF